MKAGTTSLYKYLSDHPQLYASPRKEPRVFRDAKDRKQLGEEFFRLFDARRGEPWCFEASTAYTKHPRFPGVPSRVQSIVPDARFIYLVRNPVERIWSQYVHNIAAGRESRAFPRALSEESQYLDISRYHLQLSQYHEVFPAERILVQVFEEMIADPASTVRAVCTFLGIDGSYTPPAMDAAFNVSSKKRAAPPSLTVARTFGVDKMLPWQARRWLKAQGSPLPDRKMGLTPEIRATVADSLRADTEAFFESIGRRIHAWSDFA